MKKLYINVALAALAAGVGAAAAILANAENPVAGPTLVAAGYAFLRFAAGVIAAHFDKPIPVDEE